MKTTVEATPKSFFQNFIMELNTMTASAFISEEFLQDHGDYLIFFNKSKLEIIKNDIFQIILF